ncbi:hypothetical protein DFH29DRAFT_1046360 [Suillus ampliporus]|nr:hypothetical protein DFH29DRAFT_1046360 [Suillus ampliporus]
MSRDISSSTTTRLTIFVITWAIVAVPGARCPEASARRPSQGSAQVPISLDTEKIAPHDIFSHQTFSPLPEAQYHQSTPAVFEEKEDPKDNYYVQTLNMDAPAPPAPQMQPYQRTFGNPAPLGLVAYGIVFLCSLNTDTRLEERRLTQLGLGFRYLFRYLLRRDLTTTCGHVGDVPWVYFLSLYGGRYHSDFVYSNTFSATLFATYGGFNFSFGALYLLQILNAAYSVDGDVRQEFYNAIAIYIAIWDS